MTSIISSIAVFTLFIWLSIGLSDSSTSKAFPEVGFLVLEIWSSSSLLLESSEKGLFRDIRLACSSFAGLYSASRTFHCKAPANDASTLHPGFAYCFSKASVESVHISSTLSGVRYTFLDFMFFNAMDLA